MRSLLSQSFLSSCCLSIIFIVWHKLKPSAETLDHLKGWKLSKSKKFEVQMWASKVSQSCLKLLKNFKIPLLLVDIQDHLQVKVKVFFILNLTEFWRRMYCEKQGEKIKNQKVKMLWIFELFYNRLAGSNIWDHLQGVRL